MKVFVHDDRSFSSPYCDLGKAMIRASLINSCFVSISEVEGCDKPGCSCQNKSDAIRQADPEETAYFNATVGQIQSAMTYR